MRHLVLILFLIHLVVGGFYTGKMLVWMLRRYGGYDSSVARWQQREVPYPELIARINADVPPHDRLLVYTANRDVACDLAFYCFPRPVVMLAPPAKGKGKRTLERVDGHSWAVRFPGANPP